MNCTYFNLFSAAFALVAVADFAFFLVLCSFVICVLFRRRPFEMRRCVFAYFFALVPSCSRFFAKRTHIFAICVLCVRLCILRVNRIVALLLDDKANSLLQ